MPFNEIAIIEANQKFMDAHCIIFSAFLFMSLDYHNKMSEKIEGRKFSFL